MMGIVLMKPCGTDWIFEKTVIFLDSDERTRTMFLAQLSFPLLAFLSPARGFPRRSKCPASVLFSQSIQQRVNDKRKKVAHISTNGSTFSSLVYLFSDRDRKSTRLNSSHSQISYAVFC